MTTFSSKAAVGYAHGKLILSGEHAVVYGKPAIAIPFPIEVRSTIEEQAGMIMLACAHYVGPIHKVPPYLQGIAACIKETLNYLKKPLEGLHIRIHSDIPLGRGLGSSAAIAIAIAIVRSLYSFYGQVVSQKELTTLVDVAEVYAHGKPSGIDMAAASSHFPIWFQMGKEVTPLQIGVPIYLVVADSGRTGKTRKAVQNIRANFLLEPEKMQETLDRIERITKAAKFPLLNGNSYLQ